MHRDMNQIVPDFVYQCLDAFGNTVISTTRYKKFGEEKILNELKKHGYICDIVINDYSSYGRWDECREDNRKKYEVTHVVVLREKCDAVV